MRAVLDACVLYPTVLREILTEVAAAGLYVPVWSPRIIEEWRRAAQARLGPDGAAVAGAEIALLADRFPQATVSERGDRAAGLPLPDPADAHVIEAALNAGADTIVTANLQDFPRRVLAGLGLTAIHPDPFLHDLWRRDPVPVAKAVKKVHGQTLAAGGEMSLREMMKRARLPRLGKAIDG